MNEKRKKSVRILLTALTIIIVSVLCWLIGRPMVRMVSDPVAFREWLEAKGIWGILAFVGMLVFQVFAAIIPGGPFQIAAGYSFGILRGTLLCDLSCAFASVLVFLLVRKYGHRFIELFFNPDDLKKAKFLADEKRVELLLFIFFLIPGTPKDVMTYFAGLTKCRLSRWIPICIIGRFPAILLSAISGNALYGEQYRQAIILTIVVVIISLSGSGAYMWYAARKSRMSSSEGTDSKASDE